MKITHIKITNFLGLEQLESDVPADGAIVTGGNARGKTSVFKAILAALHAQGVGAEAVRMGADRAEILLDLDAIRVRRAITAAGNTLTVTTAEGDKWGKPQTRLNTLLGSTLDPLAFYLATAAERRKQILAACPVEVTTEDFKTWTGQVWPISEGEHGLAVLDRVRKRYYDERAAVNTKVKEAEANHIAAAEKAGRLACPITGIDYGDAEKNAKDAEETLACLRSREESAKAQEKRTEGTRARISSLRQQYDEMSKEAERLMPHASAMAKAGDALAEARSKFAQLEEDLKKAKAVLADAHKAYMDLAKLQDDSNEITANAASVAAQAKDLEDTLAETSIVAPTVEEMLTAEMNAKGTAQILDAKKIADEFAAATTEAERLGDIVADTRAEAERLDRIVKTLSTTAPVELAARSHTIQGLTFEDGEIRLDGRAIDNLSGAEQLRFAVDLAKRASKAKILVVDGLERLDAEQFQSFVSYATKDGYQVIGTRVTGGELRIEAIEPSRVTIIEEEPHER